MSGCFPSVENLAPQSPDKPWQLAKTTDNNGTSLGTRPKFELPANLTIPCKHNEIVVDIGHVYNLSELIDLAQISNPDTRIAWEQSKQAASLVGLVEATYLPQISAEVIGGYQHTPLPAPGTLFPAGNVELDTKEVIPSLVIKWLLFDFGKRDSLMEAANQISIASNVAFTGAHQKLIFEVSKAYFALDAERMQLHVAQDALKSARILQDAAEAKRNSGLETVTEVAIARRETAKAQFSLERAKASNNDAYYALMEAMGLTPTLKLRIADSSGRPLPKDLADNMNIYINRALARRPDIIAALARLRASEAEVSAAKASFRPSIGLTGAAYQGIESLHIDKMPNSKVNKLGTAIFLSVKYPLYDGGIRNNSLSIARSKSAAAADELAKVQDAAVRQVARAYDTVNSALAEYESAQTLVKASNLAYDAALESYRLGVGTFTNAVSTETERAYAQSALADAYAAVLTAAAALAFSAGDLTSINALDNT